MRPVNNKKSATALFVIIMLSLQYSAAASAEEPANTLAPHVDTSDWKCKYCEFEEGFSGEVELGVGYVSDSSFKFGEYNGLFEKGAYFIANADARYRDEDADYLDLFIRDLGLETRSVGIEGGRQGSYKLFLRYDEIPHYISDSAVTPYLGSGSDLLTLPASWVRAGTTAGMTELATSLRQVDLKTKRKRVDVGMAFTPTSNWQYKLKYRHEVKEGQTATAGAFFFNAAQLIQPIDYATDQIDASVFYNSKKWQTALAYYGSFYKNNNDSLIWENAFTSGFGADVGQLDLPPDNQFNQLVLSGGYQFTEGTLASAEVSAGRMEQNDNFLPYTLNSGLAVNPLPSNSLNGLVDTLTANVKLISAISDKWRLNAAYTYNDRDNKTPQLTFDSWVTTDSFVNGPRTTLPYSFTENDFNVSADYRFMRSTKLGVGYDYEAIERTYQEADKTKENTLWAKVTVRAIDTDLILKIAGSDRDISNYTPVSEIQPPQNPLLRKYNMADRERLASMMHASILPVENITLGLSLDYATDEYSDTQIGLTDGSEFSIHADAAIVLTDKTSLHFFAGQQNLKSSQAGSQAFSTPDWFADNNDNITTAGIGITQVINEKLNIGADFTMSHSVGEVTVTSFGTPSVFPDNVTNLDSLKLYANYQFKEAMSLYLGYWYERYDSSNWALDGVTPDTIPNVLSLGIQSPSYSVDVVALSLRYQF